MLNLKRTIIKYYTINRSTWKMFGVVLLIYLLYSLLPNILYYLSKSLYKKLIPIKFLYSIIKELVAVLVTGIFFYLIYSVRDEIRKTKNELSFIIFSYKEMKKEILKQMILAEHNGLKPVNFDKIISEIYLDPKAAQNYFSQDRFFKIFNNLNELSIKSIVRRMQFFSQKLYGIGYKFVENGDDSLISILDIIKEYEWQVDEWINGSMGFDWSEAMNLKSCNPLYVMFCQEIDGKDPNLQIMLTLKEKYE